MKKLWIIFFLLILVDLIYSQSGLTDYISKNATEVRSISISDTNYTDLEAVGKALGDCRVVMLGEMWHGDGATFEAKARLIRYLHEKQGFNVLAFESDFYSLTKSIEKLEKNELVFDSVFAENIFPLWSESAQCQPLFAYMKHDPSLILCGIDNQLNGAICKTDLKKDLKAYIESSGIPYLSSQEYKEHFWKRFDTCLLVFTGSSWKHKVPYSQSLLSSIILSLDTVLAQLREKQAATGSFYHQSLLSFRALCNMYNNLKDFNKSMSIRDEQMADNLAWLAKEKFPNENIIVWLASSHMVKNNLNAYKKLSKNISMGTFYSRTATNPKGYCIGFTSDRGKGHMLGNMRYSIPKTKANSIESGFNQLNNQFLFVSIKNYVPVKDEFLYSKIDGANNLKAQWEKCVDGVFYIRTMTPSVAK